MGREVDEECDAHVEATNHWKPEQCEIQISQADHPPCLAVARFVSDPRCAVGLMELVPNAANRQPLIGQTEDDRRPE